MAIGWTAPWQSYVCSYVIPMDDFCAHGLNLVAFVGEVVVISILAAFDPCTVLSQILPQLVTALINPPDL
eukprot:4800832-Amphidinium_carterae.1